jgi:hypothetical protein
MADNGEQNSSRYSRDAQQGKNENVVKEYTGSRNTPGKAFGLAQSQDDGSNGEALDGVNLPPAPSREEALEPVDRHARQAQKLLQNEVKNTGIVKRNLGVDKLGKGLLGEAGATDSVDEFARKKAEDNGRHAKGPNIDPKETQRIYGSWSGH